MMSKQENYLAIALDACVDPNRFSFNVVSLVLACELNL